MRHKIHVPLLDDPTALREWDAVPAGDGRFRLVGRAPTTERLRFKSGETVECEIRALPGGSKGLVAMHSVSAEPEFRKRRNVFAVLGALMGAFVGAIAALWFETSPASAGIGALVGGTVFAYCSVRWGDDAWVVLSRLFRWM